ncbi:BnaC02g42500D [Brassica napus]|uniref:BnaC02g42500D protein n=1 Tax=Brassica napus TaxID=3708 RepID=A0A078I6I7_BRANA|nr:BnaC02g42500D [Brassica napus]
MNMLLGSRSVNGFQKLNKINEGTYGIVYRARDEKTKEIVALKKIKMKEDKYEEDEREGGCGRREKRQRCLHGHGALGTRLEGLDGKKETAF